MRPPEFWAQDGWPARLLAPLGAGYAAATALRRALVRPARLPVPVICVGNLVAGGAGKTPVALAVARRLRAAGREAHALTRGYGGRHHGPLRVDPRRHGHREVGDEALLLAAALPTWLARDRAAGGRAAVAGGAEVVVMDDGFQNPGLARDVALLVVDGAVGFGNGRIIPAGPLRESVAAGLARASAVVIIGPDRTGVAGRSAGLPVLRARLVPGPEAATLAGRRVVAFAGIGRPQKFFDTLRAVGAEVVAAHPFADHHPFRPAEIEALLDEANRADALCVTTAKDAARLPPETRDAVVVLTVTLAWDDSAALEAVLAPILAAAVLA